MTIQITIIGLGQIGASVGLALKSRELNIRLVGHDKNLDTMREARKLGAVHEAQYNLPTAVRNAQIVILALPFSAVRETLELIVPDLQEGILVLDTAPSKATVAAWARELLPQGRYYIGLTPAINPQYLNTPESGVKAARADMFEKGLMVVTTPSGIPGNVFNVAMDLVSLFGAMPLLMDTAEADGVFASVHLLPQLAASALLDATVHNPGWQEARKLTGRPYAAVTSGLGFQEDVLSLRDSVLENRENMVRVLNGYITSLLKLRDEIEDGDREGLLEQLESNQRGHVNWFDERLAANWLQSEGQPMNALTLGDRMSHMFLGSKRSERGKQRK